MGILRTLFPLPASANGASANGNGKTTRLAVASSVPLETFLANRTALDGRYFASEVVPYAFDVRRARALAVISSYGRRYIELAKANALGQKGVQIMPASAPVERAWERWAQDCGFGGLSLMDMQGQAVEALLRDGEMLVGLDEEDGRLRLRMLDSLQLDYERGIEYEKGAERPARYRFDRTAYFGERWDAPGEILPAADVVHVFRRIYPRQRRGLTWFRPAFGGFDALGRFSDALIKNAVESAKHSGFLEMPDDYEDRDIVGDTGAASYGEVSADAIRTKVNAIDQEIQYFDNGTRWHPMNRAAGFSYGSDYQSIRMAIIGEIATGLGVSYAALAGDVTGANFSSLRHGRLEDVAFYRAVQQFVGRFVRSVYRRWLEGAMMRGEVSRTAAAESLNPRMGFAGFEYIEPAKEAGAQRVWVESGLMSRSEIIRASGRDPDEVFAEILAERETLAPKMGAENDGAESDS